MKYTATSLLLTALLAASGFAAAQTPAALPSLSEPPKPGTTSATTRADVKSEIVRPDAATPPKNLSEPPKPGTASTTTRAEVKADAVNKERELSTGQKAAVTTPTASSAKRKMTREERRAAKKAKADMEMKSGSSAMPAPEKTTNK